MHRGRGGPIESPAIAPRITCFPGGLCRNPGIATSMSHLDNLIRRFCAQRDMLNTALGLLQVEGFDPSSIAVELGLGSGRSYDHLREALGGRALYAFDFEVATHPGFEPPGEYLVLGDILERFPDFARKRERTACLVHVDIGTRDRVTDAQRYAALIPAIVRITVPRAIVVSDRPLPGAALDAISPGPAPGKWPYFLYRRSLT